MRHGLRHGPGRFNWHHDEEMKDLAGLGGAGGRELCRLWHRAGNGHGGLGCLQEWKEGAVALDTIGPGS